jgi:hypothetical protein
MSFKNLLSAALAVFFALAVPAAAFANDGSAHHRHCRHHHCHHHCHLNHR